MMKLKDMSKTKLATLAGTYNIKGRSKMTSVQLADALTERERSERVARFGKTDEQKLTPAQRRRVNKKMARQR